MRRRIKPDSGAMGAARYREWLKLLEFALDVMNDRRCPSEVRDRAAYALLPLMHERVSPPDDEEDSKPDGGVLQ